jgi:hypothetical protein
MDEAEWLACEDPRLMLEFLEGKASDRKLLLFGCGLLLRSSGGHREVIARIVVAERFADGVGGPQELRRYWQRGDPGPHLSWPERPWEWAWSVATAAGEPYSSFTSKEEKLHLLRDVFGNPFRPVRPGPWVTPAAVEVARDCYDRRDFAALPVLADLLEEAGCPEQAVLDHCRQPGEHARGCWVVDLVLGKR